MAAPGTTVTVSASPAPFTNPTPTGTWFVDGLTQRGTVGAPVLLTSLADYTTLLGARVPYGNIYDSAEIFFREGGNAMYVSRDVGPAAVTATLALKDRTVTAPPTTLTVNALGQGIWGNNVAVAVINAPGSVVNYQLQITYLGALVETSSVLTSPADAVAWGKTSRYVRVLDAGSASVVPTNNPVVIAATTLAAGVDDNLNVTDAIRTASRAVFTADLGPGQVSSPGVLTPVTQGALIAHAQAFNRLALLDMPDTPTAATAISAAGVVQSAAVDPSYAAIVGPWLIYPGSPTGTATPAFPRTIPPVAGAAALMARSDASNLGEANLAAAASNGILTSASGITQTFIPSDLDALNTAGICIIRTIANQGGTQLYGYRSLALDPSWLDLANVRFRMQLVFEGQQIGSSFVFAQIDGKGQTLAAFGGALASSLAKHWEKGSLYGATPSQAFKVNIGPTVNTPATIAGRQINAVESVRMSPSAEFVNISIVKYAVTQTLP